MNTLASLFDIHTTFFSVWQYDMSYLEFFGTIFTIWCVWLTTRAKILSWPVGLIGSVLYLFLFYQIQLYSDVFEQVYFLITGALGWFMWVSRAEERKQDDSTVLVSICTQQERLVVLGGVVVGTAILAFITLHLSVWFPAYFPEPVSMPILDAGTTAMSFIAQWLLMRKKIENWVLWIVVDAIDIGLYWYKGVKFVSVEYILFFCMAISGLRQWLAIRKQHPTTSV